MAIKTNDLQALGLILVGYFTLILSMRETAWWVQYPGIIGSVILIIAEMVFYYQAKLK